MVVGTCEGIVSVDVVEKVVSFVVRWRVRVVVVEVVFVVDEGGVVHGAGLL